MLLPSLNKVFTYLLTYLLAYLVIFHAFLMLKFILKSTFFEKKIQEYHVSVKQLGPRSGPTFVGPDLGPYCLQRLSVDHTSRLPKSHPPVQPNKLHDLLSTG